MLIRVRSFGILAGFALAACSSGSSAPAGKVEVQFCAGLDCSLTSLATDGSTVTVSVVATNSTGGAATGTVHITVLVGTVDGKASEDLVLDATGAATATYACNLSTSAGCASSATLVSATWNGISGSARLHLGSGGTGGGSGGGTGGGSGGGVVTGDGGTPVTVTIQVVAVSPASIGTAAAAANGLPTSALLTFQVEANSAPLAGQTVSFTAAQGESLIALSPSSAVSDANGNVAVTATSESAAGVAHVIASLGVGRASVIGQVGIFGPPASIIETATVPALLGIRGSGIQEQGLTTFKVTDAYGTAIPNASIDFTEDQPLITFNVSTAATDATGNVQIGYTSGPEVGIATIIATAHGANVKGRQQVAVRGAKPSAGAMYFRCARANLPVYTTTNQFQSTTCTVRLSDRFGNRVGIATPVTFATEAGSISASAMTKAFDTANPTDPDEGSATVTFSTDMSDGNRPVDVAPLDGEPSVTVNGATRNPRDQLVTIIAMAQGEEQFFDANHNGAFDSGETFVDQSDPFIDSDDDGLWSANEAHFCGSVAANGVCPIFHGPNGTWDSQTTIWKPTWVVFSGAGVGSTAPAGGASPASLCADFADAPFDGNHSSSVTALVYVYDDFLNAPASGSTATVQLAGAATTGTLSSAGFGPQLDQWGAMGIFGFDFDYKDVAQTGGGACTTGSGICVEKLVFNDFDSGLLGAISFTNTDKLPAGMTGNGCAPSSNGQPDVSVGVQISTTTGAISEVHSETPFTRASSAASGLRVLAQSTVPSTIYTSDGTLSGLATTSTVTFAATSSSGAPLANETLTIAEKAGESLVSLASFTATTNASGLATVVVSAGPISGTATIIATLPFGAASGSATLAIAEAASSGVQVVATSVSPATIYTAGAPSPLATSTVVTFLATDASGAAIAGKQLSFSEAAGESLVSVSPSSAITDGSGHASTTVTAESVAGTAHVVASLPFALATGTAAINLVSVASGFQLALQGVSPTTVYTSDAPAGLAKSATVTFVATNSSGTRLAGATVSFAELASESLVTLGATSATTDATGAASVTVTAGATSGTAHIVASLGGNTASAALQIVGAPASVIETANTPSVLGIQGSGIQEQGLMIFQVTDAHGTPVPNARVDFTEGQPNLVTFNAASGSTDSSGNVQLAYTAGSEVGVTNVIATAHGTAAHGSHQVAVRGAKPSASGFYFRCDHGNLRVYDKIAAPVQMICHVRLSDRFGNRVGIATPVNFATEAGAISASAVTKAFDFAKPDDPDEGTVDVTFSTDMGNGSSPADVAPLVPDSNVNQYPSQRTKSEPSRTAGQITFNPRDQLVTIIAWTQGEEAFVDADHNGAYTAGELFIDQGDPFIDENDDNVYNQVVPGGQFEPRFCGSSGSACGAYQGPNGVWDAQATIWTPTWVVFSGAPVPSDTSAGASTPASAFAPESCADYSDLNASGHSSLITAEVYVYDEWFNTPVAGTTYKQGNVISPQATSIGADISLAGFVAEAEGYGALGQLGLTGGFWYGPVSTTGGPCTVANGTKCVFNLHIQSFDSGDRGTILFANPNLGGGKLGCAPGANNNKTPVPFSIEFGAVSSDGTTGLGDFAGTFAPALSP